jgi:hypothetical protein
MRPLKKLKNHVGGIGGSADECLLEDVEVRFLSDDGTVAIVPFPILPIIVQRESMVKRMVEFFRTRFLGKKRRRIALPSLLGFDFLQECKISFSEKEAYLDID